MKKEIMTRAWQIKRENELNIFALCLKMAWAEQKNKIMKVIELENITEWKRGRYGSHRIVANNGRLYVVRGRQLTKINNYWYLKFDQLTSKDYYKTDQVVEIIVA